MEGSGFEVRGVLREGMERELRGELFYILNVFFFFFPPSLFLSGIPVWSLVRPWSRSLLFTMFLSKY